MAKVYGKRIEKSSDFQIFGDCHNFNTAFLGKIFIYIKQKYGEKIGHILVKTVK